MSSTGTIVRVDPGSLIVAANVRANTKLTKEFVASVKLHGVLVPITARESADGLAVVDGQRRTLAAMDAGVTEVPVFVVDLADEAQRIVDQVVVNAHREDLDDVEQVLALKELEQLGVSAAAIAKRTGTARKAVDSALVVAASSSTLDAMREQQLSFDVAIAVAEFDGDPEAQARVISSGASRWAVEREREDRAIRLFGEQLVADGFTVIDPPSWEDPTTKTISSLWMDEALTVRAADAPHEEFAARAGDGLRAWVGNEWTEGGGRAPVARWAVEGWAERGFHSTASSSSSAPTSPEEQAAAKEQRRRDRETSKAWAVATVVRVTWLQELLRRKSFPKGWERLSVEQSMRAANQGYPWSMVLALLQVERDPSGLGKYDVQGYLDAHPTRASQVALALALGSVEGARDFEKKGWQHFGVKPYLELLASWGYELTDVEREVVGVEAAAA